MTGIYRVAVELVDVVLDRSTCIVAEGHVVERRGTWIKVFSDTELANERGAPYVTEEKVSSCKGCYDNKLAVLS